LSSIYTAGLAPVKPAWTSKEIHAREREWGVRGDAEKTLVRKTEILRGWGR